MSLLTLAGSAISLPSRSVVGASAKAQQQISAKDYQAALSLLKTLISEPTASSLFLSCGGSLKESICALFDGDIELCPPLMDVIDFDAYDSLMTQLGGMADGSADIETTIRTAFGA